MICCNQVNTASQHCTFWRSFYYSDRITEQKIKIKIRSQNKCIELLMNINSFFFFFLDQTHRHLCQKRKTKKQTCSSYLPPPQILQLSENLKTNYLSSAYILKEIKISSALLCKWSGIHGDRSAFPRCCKGAVFQDHLGCGKKRKWQGTSSTAQTAVLYSGCPG